jgi:hypothetical protein
MPRKCAVSDDGSPIAVSMASKRPGRPRHGKVRVLEGRTGKVLRMWSCASEAVPGLTLDGAGSQVIIVDGAFLQICAVAAQRAASRGLARPSCAAAPAVTRVPGRRPRTSCACLRPAQRTRGHSTCGTCGEAAGTVLRGAASRSRATTPALLWRRFARTDVRR